MATAASKAARSFATQAAPALRTAASATATASTAPPQTYFRITLRRSAIGLPEQIGRTLAALGLHKRMRTVFHPVSTDVAGQILAVKELVAVSEVPSHEVLTRAQLKDARKPMPGFYLEQTSVGTPVQDLMREGEAIPGYFVEQKSIDTARAAHDKGPMESREQEMPNGQEAKEAKIARQKAEKTERKTKGETGG